MDEGSKQQMRPWIKPGSLYNLPTGARADPSLSDVAILHPRIVKRAPPHKKCLRYQCSRAALEDQHEAPLESLQQRVGVQRSFVQLGQSQLGAQHVKTGVREVV